MNIKIFVAFFAIAGLVIIPGCMEDKVDANEIRSNALESMDDFATYKMDMSTDIDMNIRGIETSASSSASWKIDKKNHRMMQESTDMAGMKTETFFIDDMQYLKTASGIWTKKKLSETEVEGLWSSAVYRDVLEGTKVEYLGDEKVRGKDCWIIKATPDKKKLREYVEKFTGSGSAKEIHDVEFRNISIRSWVAKDNYFIMKVEQHIDIAMTVKYASGEESIEMDIMVVTEMYDYNKPSSIVLPEEAV